MIALTLASPFFFFFVCERVFFSFFSNALSFPDPRPTARKS